MSRKYTERQLVHFSKDQRSFVRIFSGQNGETQSAFLRRLVDQELEKELRTNQQMRHIMEVYRDDVPFWYDIFEPEGDLI